MHRPDGWTLGLVICLAMMWLGPAAAAAADLPSGEAWVASWTGSAQGPYPLGNPSAQPELKFALPSADQGARDQSFREIVRPDLWGKQVRLRFSNAFGDRSVTIDGAFVGLQMSGAEIVHATNTPVLFAGKPAATIAPGETVRSDAATLPFFGDPADPLLAGRRLAVSFHVAGESGKLTWHAKALTTSYLGPQGGGAHGSEEGEASYPFSTTSWFVLDEVDVSAPADTVLIAAFGDSITDGTASTLNGDDRWPDVLSRRLHAAYGTRVAIVNAGIGGNQLIGPPDYAATPIAGGPSALSRLDRDVFALPGLRTVIWLEGINDYNAGAETASVIGGMHSLVERAHAQHLRIVGGTLTTALHASLATPTQHGTEAVDAKRRAHNDFIRSAGLFDGIVDFDAATRDPESGELKPQFVPGSTIGGAGDKLHPNRAGYMAMGQAVDLSLLMPPR